MYSTKSSSGSISVSKSFFSAFSRVLHSSASTGVSETGCDGLLGAFTLAKSHSFVSFRQVFGRSWLGIMTAGKAFRLPTKCVVKYVQRELACREINYSGHK